MFYLVIGVIIFLPAMHRMPPMGCCGYRESWTSLRR